MSSDHDAGAYLHLTAFLTAKRATGLSPLTIKWYDMLVRQYLDWSTFQKLPNKKPETVEAWFSSLREGKKSAFTISGCYRALSVYFKWLTTRKHIRRSPMETIQPPNVPKQRKPHVTVAQFRKLYHSIDGDRWVDHRDRAILLMLLYTGLRASELIALMPEHIDRTRGIIAVSDGKGGQDRDVPFANFILETLDCYLSSRPPHPSGKLFVSMGGANGTARGPLTYSGLKEIMRRRCEAAGMKRLGLHMLRHSYAMIFLNDGEMDLPAISKAMGHSSLDLTRRFYADFETTTLRREYNRAVTRIGDII